MGFAHPDDQGNLGFCHIFSLGEAIARSDSKNERITGYNSNLNAGLQGGNFVASTLNQPTFNINININININSAEGMIELVQRR